MLMYLRTVASEKKVDTRRGKGGGGVKAERGRKLRPSLLHQREEKKKSNRIKQMQCSQRSQTTGHDHIRDNHKKKKKKIEGIDKGDNHHQLVRLGRSSCGSAWHSLFRQRHAQRQYRVIRHQYDLLPSAHPASIRLRRLLPGIHRWRGELSGVHGQGLLSVRGER